ncbi:MAG: hypothetical protein J5685_08950 [Clostridiales bacterium]|nr:hypothetical protein [Clostridiales bacterium]
MEKKNTKIAVCLITVMTVIMSIFGTLSANSLPEPAFHLSVQKAPKDREYFVILFHEENSGYMENYYIAAENDEDRDALSSLDSFLAEYEDPDGLRPTITRTVNRGDSRIAYYGTINPGGSLKIVIYFPDNGEYRVSDIFTVMGRHDEYRIDLSAGGDHLTVENYNDGFMKRRMSVVMLCNLVFTLIIETCIAKFFGYKTKKEIVTVFLTNLVTNVTANVIMLIFIKYFLILFLLLEASVLALEFAVYNMVFPKERKRKTLFGYVFVANAFSALSMIFAMGLVTYILKAMGW